MKLALRNYAGTPTRYFLVETETVGRTGGAVATVKAPSHHICVLDVSGSMWSDLEAVKTTVEKVFTAEEFNDPSLRVSLITYASNGDCVVHFQRVTVAEVLAPCSPHLKEIRNLRTRGCTGISQALVTAEKLIDDQEVTCLSLHTDGYANDPSPYQEALGIVKAVEALGKHPQVFCNTLGYRSYCDFPLLAAIANKLSGSCLQVQTARQVYEALHAAQAMLAGKVAPALAVDIGKATYVAFLSKDERKVLGGTSSMVVRGLRADADGQVFRYREVPATEYQAATEGEWPENVVALLVLCRVLIAQGAYTQAKYAMVSTRVPELVEGHARALVASEIAAWTAAVEDYLVGPEAMVGPACWQSEYGLGGRGPSVLAVLHALSTFKSGLRVNVEALSLAYQRRGLKRVPGKRDDQGNITPPGYWLQTPQDQTAVPVAAIEINSDTATANLKVVQDGVLTDRVTAQPVPEVAGIKLALKSYRNYTVVGDGQVNIPSLSVRIADKRLHQWLQVHGLVPEKFDPETQYTIDLSKLPLVDYDQVFQVLPRDKVADLIRFTVFQKMLAGLIKGESEALTPEQITALAACHITPALYFSPPTTVPYTDLQTALAQGEVDSRLRYKVKIGTPSILHAGVLPSGNAYLQRRFTLKLADGTEVAKPTLDMWWLDGNTWGEKVLSSRTKLTEVDTVAFPLYQDFFLGRRTGVLREFLATLGLDADAFVSALSGGCTKDETLAVFTAAKRAVDDYLAIMVMTMVSPLAFYVGATGLVPDSFQATALTADQLVAKYPDVALAKAEKEGTFYELPNGVILSVFTETAYFSTDHGVGVAWRLASEHQLSVADE